MSFPKKKTRRKYDASFKEDVIKMATAGCSISEISNSLGVSASLINGGVNHPIQQICNVLQLNPILFEFFSNLRKQND